MRPSDTLIHAELVKRAERWLRNVRRCGVVLCEVAAGSGETPDAIGWRYGGQQSVLVECKVSRADFLADKGKPFRKPDCQGAMGDERYYLAPAGIITLSDLPERWGLLEIVGRGIKCRKAAEKHSPQYSRKRNEMGLLWSEVRLMQLARTGRPLFPSKRALRIERAIKDTGAI